MHQGGRGLGKKSFPGHKPLFSGPPNGGGEEFWKEGGKIKFFHYADFLTTIFSRFHWPY